MFVLMAVVALGAVGWSGWIAWKVNQSLSAAVADAQDLREALEEADEARIDRSLTELQFHTSAAAEGTSGATWSALTILPNYGDDAQGVRALAASLDALATHGIKPLAETANSLEELTSQGRVDVDVVESLADPVARASASVDDAASLVMEVESTNFVSALKAPFQEYVDQIGDLKVALKSAELATSLAPKMLGSEGPRDYLLIFQNNAEIRATGGLPGSWARIHADNGLITMMEQGSAADFPVLEKPVVNLSQGELMVYGEAMGQYWQDPGFTPDFPRAAELFNAFWRLAHEETPLDGVVAIDPVALSYLLEGTGAVNSSGLSVTSENAAQILMNQIYLDNPDPLVQDRVFQSVARSIFEVATKEIASPLSFISGLNRASQERRLLVAPFREEERVAIEGTAVEGALPSEADADPNVFVGLNDATGSKMSYYLRYWGEVSAVGCKRGVQSLAGKLTLNQTISPSVAKGLPEYVTGGGIYGTTPGDQLVLVRLYSPVGGELSNIRINGVASAFDDISVLQDRAVASIPISIETVSDTIITWQMQSGQGQVGDIRLGLTPSVVPGSLDRSVRSSC